MEDVLHWLLVVQYYAVYSKKRKCIGEFILEVSFFYLEVFNRIIQFWCTLENEKALFVPPLIKYTTDEMDCNKDIFHGS